MYIKGLGWIDDTPKRPVLFVCTDCGKEWDTDFIVLTEADIMASFPVEPVLAYCEKHDYSAGPETE